MPLVIVICVAVCILLIRSIHIKEKLQVVRSVTSLTRGERSERDLIYRLVKKCGIPANTIFHDLYVPNRNGYTQVDLVVPTNVGVFVFEVKDYSGWIFGNGNNEKWTQVLAYGQEKHQFYNPIKQNKGHIEALKRSLPQFQNIPFFSIVVFYGTSEIRALSNVPEDCRVVYPNQVAKLMKNSIANLSPAPYTDKWEAMRVLRSAVENGEDSNVVLQQQQRAQFVARGKYKSTYTYRSHLVGHVMRKCWRLYR